MKLLSYFRDTNFVQGGVHKHLLTLFLYGDELGLYDVVHGA